MSILHNLSQHPDSKVLLPPEVLQAARRNNSIICDRICAILCNESEATSLKLDVRFVTDQAYELKSILANDYDAEKNAGREPDSLLDVCLPFVNLSINDANKDLLGTKLIGLLLQVVAIDDSTKLINRISSCLTRARQEAAKALWNLAFLEANRKRIEAEGGIQILTQVLARADDVLKENISGVLFMFERSLQPAAPATQKPIATGTPAAAPALASLSETNGHVMISYNWSHQHIALRLEKSLTELGYSVWLDVSQMKGSTLGAMADAIEGASMVLMCASQKYKDSPNCRLEGEYCMSRRIHFIPLIVQQGYRADGWLGLVMGTRLYHDFADENNWDAKMVALTKEIGDCGKGNGKNRPSPSQPASTTATATKGTKDWTTEEVQAWLKSVNLASICGAFSSCDIDGVALLELKNSLASPPIFLHFMERMKLNTIPVGLALRLNSALKQL